jgi:hypothetical protein
MFCIFDIYTLKTPIMTNKSVVATTTMIVRIFYFTFLFSSTILFFLLKAIP